MNYRITLGTILQMNYRITLGTILQMNYRITIGTLLQMNYRITIGTLLQMNYRKDDLRNNFTNELEQQSMVHHRKYPLFYL